jgi:hypothetical protein
MKAISLDNEFRNILSDIEKENRDLEIEKPIERSSLGDVVSFYGKEEKGRIAKFILRKVKSITPVGKSKNLVNSFSFLLDKNSLVDDTVSDEVLNKSNEIFITNWRPYISKIEKGSSFQAPSGIFEILEMEFKRKFPNMFIEYNWRFIPSSKINDEYSTRDNRYPGLVIRDEQ